MTWLLLERDKYKHAIKELPTQRDRGAAIIAAAILEDHLLLAIQARIQRHEFTEKRMFANDGPLNSFAAKIDLGVLLGIYPSGLQRQLHIIRGIRNKFAHNMPPLSFKSQRGECEKLRPPKGAYRAFNKSYATMMGTKLDWPMLRLSTNPRTQYMRAVQFVTTYLTFQTVGAQIKTWAKEKNEAPQPASRDRPQQLGLPPS